MNFKYNADYFPAAPQVEIRLGIPDQSLKIGPLSAFVDSGADATIIPLRYIRQLDVQAEDTKFIRSQWGESRQIDIYWLDLGIGDLRLPAIEIVGDDRGNEVILGRNVLNMLRVLLDGPKQIVELSE
ncbi:MAG: retroviral-like aspartic protease family protein [Chloroflexi bacterium]|nr:retroviral-like aspartic protease family protein [Chloroflexota bacterium]